MSTGTDSAAVDPGLLLRPRRDVRFRIIDREAVVLRQEAAETLVLNEVGARILSLLDGTTSAKALIDQLEREFEVERAVLEADCHEFLAELNERGVLEAAAEEDMEAKP
jgi:hypothetical protein